MPTLVEKRRHPRIPVTLKIQRRTTTHEPESVEYASDLSRGGLFIRTANRAKAGTKLQIQFAPGEGNKFVQADCRVVRVTNEGMAIEFTQLDQDSQLLLSMALSS